MFSTKKFKENNDCDILETLYECNEQEHQNSKYFEFVKVSKSIQPS